MFVRKLPRLPQIWVNVVCDLIMIYCCWLIVLGGYDQTILNRRNYLSVSGLPESLVYGSCFWAGVFIGLIVLVRLIGRLASLGQPDGGEAGAVKFEGRAD
jgi:TRAP-type C4-dicarboxylate transport system permease small subunit